MEVNEHTVKELTIQDDLISNICDTNTMVIYLGGCCDSGWKDELSSMLKEESSEISNGKMLLVKTEDGELPNGDVERNIKVVDHLKSASDLLIYNLCCDEICPLTMFEIGRQASQYNILVLVDQESPIYAPMKSYQSLYGFDMFESDDMSFVKQYVMNRFLKRFPQKLSLASYAKCCEPCAISPACSPAY